MKSLCEIFGGSSRPLALPLAAGLVLGLVAHAASGADPAQLYTRGKAAFDRPDPDFVVALEYLAAYREAAADVLAGDASFRRSLDQAIDYASAELSLALATKRQLDKYGEVREVTIETGGKLDTAGSSKQEVSVRLPARHLPPKPRLASRPPSGSGAGTQAVVSKKMLPVDAARLGTAEPVERPPGGEADGEAQLQECREKLESQARRLDDYAKKLEAVRSDAASGSAQELAACRERLSAAGGKCQELQQNFNELTARYLALEAKCSDH